VIFRWRAWARAKGADTVSSDGASSALGFYYQGCYALVALLRLADDAAGVAVETHDDVVLESPSLKTLAQIKNKQAPLSVRSDDFWKAVGRWTGRWRWR
jgi:Cap4-like dsDNA endonuclease family protein